MCRFLSGGFKIGIEKARQMRAFLLKDGLFVAAYGLSERNLGEVDFRLRNIVYVVGQHIQRHAGHDLD